MSRRVLRAAIDAESVKRRLDDAAIWLNEYAYADSRALDVRITALHGAVVALSSALALITEQGKAGEQT